MARQHAPGDDIGQGGRRSAVLGDGGAGLALNDSNCRARYFAAASFSGSFTASKVANSTAQGSPSFFSTLRI